DAAVERVSTGRNFDDRAGVGGQELFLELLLVGRVVSRQGLRRRSTAAAGGKSTQKSDSDFAHGYLPISRKSPIFNLSIACGGESSGRVLRLEAPKKQALESAGPT